jgi:hypothetical protein
VIDPSDVRGMYGDALAAIEEANAYGFDSSAAFWAAMDHLDGASQDQAVFIASVLASWIATFLNPTHKTDLPEWIREAAGVAARNWTDE